MIQLIKINDNRWNEIVYSFTVNDKSEITEEKLFLNDKEMFSRIKNKVKTILIENDDNDILEETSAELDKIERNM